MSKSIFVRKGVSFIPTPEAAVDIHDTLPAGNYVVKQDPDTQQFFFDQVDPFKPYSRVYGNLPKRAERIWSTFQARPNSTGVLAVGEKGSGKTMLSKLLSLHGFNQGIPTILVNQAWAGDGFNNLIQSVTQPAIVLIDEAEKVYQKPELQEQLLTLLDGVFPSKKLFLLTCNDIKKIDGHMRNRPGRLFYMLHFRGLERTFIEEYCADALVDDLKHHVDTIVKIAGFFDQFNFDMLQALVEEMNRYNESPEEAMDMLNAKPGGEETEYAVNVVWKGKVQKSFHPSTLNGTPIGRNRIELHLYDQDDQGDEDGSMRVTITPDDLVAMNTKDGTFEYQQKDTLVTFVRKSTSVFDLRSTLAMS